MEDIGHAWGGMTRAVFSQPVGEFRPLTPSDLGVFVGEETAGRLQEFMSQPNLAWAGILVAWLLIGRIFSPVHDLAVGLLYPGLTYR